MTGRRWAAAVGLVVATAVGAAAQIPQAVPGDALAWDQAAGSAAEAQGWRYEVILNGAPTRPAVTCAGAASPFVCEWALAGLTGINQIVVVTAIKVLDDGRELRGEASAEFQFAWTGPPSRSEGLRIRPGPVGLVVRPPGGE